MDMLSDKAITSCDRSRSDSASRLLMGLPGVENDLGVPESCLVGLEWSGLDVKDRPDSEIYKRKFVSYGSIQPQLLSSYHRLQGIADAKCSPVLGINRGCATDYYNKPC
jgi:hypothetical protein